MGYRLPSFCFHTFNIFRQLRFINPLSVSSSWCQFFRGHNHSKPFCFNKSQYLSSPPSLLLQNTYHGVLMYFLCQVGSPSFCSLSLSLFFFAIRSLIQTHVSLQIASGNILKSGGKITLENIIFVSKSISSPVRSIFFDWFAFSGNVHRYKLAGL